MTVLGLAFQAPEPNDGLVGACSAHLGKESDWGWLQNESSGWDQRFAGHPSFVWGWPGNIVSPAREPIEVGRLVACTDIR